MRKLLISSIAIMTMTGAALAGDLPSNKEAPVFLPPPPVFTWTGFYIGANVGFGSGSADWSNIVVPSDPGQNLPGVFAKDNLSGAVVGGGQIGYRQQYNAFVFGVEGKFDASGVNGSQICFGSYNDHSASCRVDNQWLADITGSIGYSVTERLLLSAKGGVAFANSDFQPDMDYKYYGNYNVTNQTNTGWVVGASIDYAVSDHWILGFEYDHYDFGTDSVAFTQNAAAKAYSGQWLVIPFNASVSQSFDTVIGKVSYKF